VREREREEEEEEEEEEEGSYLVHFPSIQCFGVKVY
jgi:hypothetical protein